MKEFISSSDAFNDYLKELCLNEFPAGDGDGRWRNNLTFRSDLLGTTISEDPQLMTTESLKELSDRAPFKKDVKWSKNAKDLQNKSIINPQSINKKNMHLYFKHLRLVNKNINIIDAGFRKFSNLSELIVSANHIESVNSSSLPQKLKVLELCGNNVSNLASLSLNPPPLQHLGLSNNKIHSLSHEQLKPSTWSCLLSLDLSFNKFQDMVPLVSTLSQLPKLRNLLLQGNPLFLFPGYRGYVIDSIKSLTLFDDVRISADERHLFKGLSKLKDLPFSEFVLLMDLDELRGFKRSYDMETQEDFPKTVFKYVVEFDFIDDFEIFDQEELLHEKEENIDDMNDNVEGAGDKLISEISVQKEGGACNNVKSNIIKTDEFSIAVDDPTCLNFSKAIRSDSQFLMHQHLLKKIEIRLVESKVVVSNEPKPVNEKYNLREVPKGSGRTKSKILPSKKEDKEKEKAPVKTGKVKKVNQDIELFEWSRTSHVIASTMLDLQHLLVEESTSRKCDITLQRHQVPDDLSLSSFDESFSKKDLLSAKKKGKESTRGSSTRSMSSTTRVTNSRAKLNKPGTPSVSVEPQDSNTTCVSLALFLELKRWKNAKDGLLWIQKRLKL